MTTQTVNIHLDHPDLANSILGKKIPITVNGKETQHNETVYNINEVYNVKINYNKKSQTFQLTGNDNNKLQDAVKVFQDIINKKVEDHNKFIAYKKREKEREKRQRFYEKEEALAQSIQYELEHSNEQHQVEKKSVNVVSTSKSNPYFGLEIDDDSDTETNTPVPTTKHTPTTKNTVNKSKTSNTSTTSSPQPSLSQSTSRKRTLDKAETDEEESDDVEESTDKSNNDMENVNHEIVEDIQNTNDKDDSFDIEDESNAFPRNRKYYNADKKTSSNNWSQVVGSNLNTKRTHNNTYTVLNGKATNKTTNNTVNYTSNYVANNTATTNKPINAHENTRRAYNITESLMDKLNVLIGIGDEKEFPELAA
jgi:hypothetical protein